MHKAAQKGYYGICQLLVRRNDIDKNLLNDYSKTPLDFAIDEGKHTVALLLKQEGCLICRSDWPAHWDNVFAVEKPQYSSGSADSNKQPERCLSCSASFATLNREALLLRNEKIKRKLKPAWKN